MEQETEPELGQHSRPPPYPAPSPFCLPTPPPPPTTTPSTHRPLQVHDNTDRDGLCLEDLPEGSLLEACLVLGRLKEEGYELAKPAKGDCWLKVRCRGGGLGWYW